MWCCVKFQLKCPVFIEFPFAQICFDYFLKNFFSHDISVLSDIFESAASAAAFSPESIGALRAQAGKRSCDSLRQVQNRRGET